MGNTGTIAELQIKVSGDKIGIDNISAIVNLGYEDYMDLLIAWGLITKAVEEELGLTPQVMAAVAKSTLIDKAVLSKTKINISQIEQALNKD